MYFKELSSYLVADAYSSKPRVVKTILDLGLHFISRLRDDISLTYIYRGQPMDKHGAPKKYDGKVDPKSRDMNHFSKAVACNKLTIYSARVYCVAFETTVNLAIATFKKTGKKLQESYTSQ